MMNTVDGVGSSSVLRRALAASSFIIPPSSNRNTFRSATIGARLACATAWRAWSTVTDARPSGSIRTRSGWFPAKTRRRYGVVGAHQGGGEASGHGRLSHTGGTDEEIRLRRPAQLGPQHRQHRGVPDHTGEDVVHSSSSVVATSSTTRLERLGGVDTTNLLRLCGGQQVEALRHPPLQVEPLAPDPVGHGLALQPEPGVER